MSRIGKTSVYRCPDCRAVYTRPSYSSINFIGGYSYSDGYLYAPLYKRFESVVSPCKCGCWIELTENNRIGYAERPPTVFPTPLSWQDRLKGLFKSATAVPEKPDVLEPSVDEPSSWWNAPVVPFATAEMLVSILNTNLDRFRVSDRDELIEWRIRSRLREMFNERFRKEPSEYPRTSDEIVTAHRLENLQMLLKITEPTTIYELVSRVELYREAGEVQLAKVLFEPLSPRMYGFDESYLKSIFGEERVSVSLPRLEQLEHQLQQGGSAVYVTAG